MKTTIYLNSITFIFLFILFGCNTSPKKIISNGEEWLISDTIKLPENQLANAVTFKDSIIAITGENKSHLIKWIDNTSYSQDFNGKRGIIKIRKLSNTLLEFAILFDSENIPKSDLDWQKLENDKKVMYFIKKNNGAETYKYYKVGKKSVPVDKVPPAGLYLSNGKADGFAINVSIVDGIVKFQAGEDKHSLNDVDVEINFEGLESPYISSIEFSNEWSSCELIDDGTIENSGSFFNGNSGGSLKFIRVSSVANANDVETLLSGVIGTFNYGKAKLEYNKIKAHIDRQYSENSNYYKYLTFEIDDKYLLTSEKYSYPFDIQVILFKIYPANISQYNFGQNYTSIGGVVFEKRYGEWFLINTNLLIVPINPKMPHREVFQMNPIINKSNGTIEFRYHERYTLAIGSFSSEYITYSFSPYMNEITKNTQYDYEGRQPYSNTIVIHQKEQNSLQ